MRKNILGNERGVALIIALLMLLVLTIVGIGTMSSTTFENMISGNDRTATDAFYAAEAGVELQMNQIPDQLPNLTPVSRGIGADALCWSGSPQNKQSPTIPANLGLYFRPGYESIWGFDRYQMNATGQSFSSVKEVEIQMTWGPYKAGTEYN
jgi:Tfp pilus assembly protein PilX